MSYSRVVRAIRRFCLECQGGAAREVRRCPDLDCALRIWRMAGARGTEQPGQVEGCIGAGCPASVAPGAVAAAAAAAVENGAAAREAVVPPECVPPGNEGEVVPPLRAIRRFCLHCCGFRDAIRGCDARDACALWSYRFGVRPETYRRVKARFYGTRPLVLPGFVPGKQV